MPTVSVRLAISRKSIRVRVYVSTGKRETIIVPKTYTTIRYGLTFVRLKTGGEIVVQPGQESPKGIEILSGLVTGDVLIDVK